MKKVNLINAITFLITMILVVIVFSFSINRINSFHSNNTYEAIVEQKKIHIYENVNNQIIRIQGYQNSFTNNLFQISDSHIDSLLEQTLSESDTINSLSYLDLLIPDAYTILLYKNNSIIYNPSNISVNVDNLELNDSFSSQNVYHFEPYRLFIGINQAYVDNKIFDQVRTDILSANYELHSYMWINQILNYDGGDDYAVRFIHPNSIPQSGVMLSTNTEVYGIRPYLLELDGVKQDGEVYFTYHFQLPGSTELAEKITYAKLYEPYNWVIAMGIYIEDISSYSERARAGILSFSLQVSSIFIAIFLVANLLNFGLMSRLTKKRVELFADSMLEEANRDELTHAFLRRVAIKHFEKFLKDKQAKPSKSFGFLLFDIDYFKQINDRFGHKMGDTILSGIVDHLQTIISSSHEIYRWGGDEFILIIENTSEAENFDQARKIVESIATTQFSCDGISTSITISLGLTYIQVNDSLIDDAVSRADRALYYSKKNGRNQATKYNSQLDDFINSDEFYHI